MYVPEVEQSRNTFLSDDTANMSFQLKWELFLSIGFANTLFYILNTVRKNEKKK